MHIFKLMKSAAVEANFLAVASILILLVKISILNKYPSWLPIFFDLGILLESILASIVAGYVFYIFVNHLQEFQRNKVVFPFIFKQSQRIVGECKSQLIEVSKHVELAFELSTVRLENIIAAFTKLDPKADAPLIMGNTGNYGTWLQFFEHHNFRTKERIRKLLDQLPYVPAKMLAIISEIEDSSHFAHTRTLQNKTIKNENLSFHADSFYKYCKLCRELELLNEGIEIRH
jgi:hypothetical protein